MAEPGKAPRRNASVIVRGRTIAEVRDGFVDVPGARVVDLRTATVLPGLIDSHVHLRGLDDRFQARLAGESAATMRTMPTRRCSMRGRPCSPASPRCATSAATRA